MGEVSILPTDSGETYSPPSPISASDDVADFVCGNAPLDDWLRLQALRSEGRSARTYVIKRGHKVVGYYCLATGSETHSNAPGKVRRNTANPIPLITIGRLAVDQQHQGKRLGENLLKDALSRSLAMSDVVGCRVVLVHAIDQQAMAFYARYGFVEFPFGSLTLFLPMETIKQAVG